MGKMIRNSLDYPHKLDELATPKKWGWDTFTILGTSHFFWQWGQDSETCVKVQGFANSFFEVYTDVRDRIVVLRNLKAFIEGADASAPKRKQNHEGESMLALKKAYSDGRQEMLRGFNPETKISNGDEALKFLLSKDFKLLPADERSLLRCLDDSREEELVNALEREFGMNLPVKALDGGKFFVPSDASWWDNLSTEDLSAISWGVSQRYYRYGRKGNLENVEKSLMRRWDKFTGFSHRMAICRNLFAALKGAQNKETRSLELTLRDCINELSTLAISPLDRIEFSLYNMITTQTTLPQMLYDQLKNLDIKYHDPEFSRLTYLEASIHSELGPKRESAGPLTMPWGNCISKEWLLTVNPKDLYSTPKIGLQAMELQLSSKLGANYQFFTEFTFRQLFYSWGEFGYDIAPVFETIQILVGQYRSNHAIMIPIAANLHALISGAQGYLSSRWQVWTSNKTTALEEAKKLYSEIKSTLLESFLKNAREWVNPETSSSQVFSEIRSLIIDDRVSKERPVFSTVLYAVLGCLETDFQRDENLQTLVTNLESLIERGDQNYKDESLKLLAGIVTIFNLKARSDSKGHLVDLKKARKKLPIRA